VLKGAFEKGKKRGKAGTEEGLTVEKRDTKKFQRAMRPGEKGIGGSVPRPQKEKVPETRRKLLDLREECRRRQKVGGAPIRGIL